MSEKLKALEGQRLYRALRYFFKKRSFKFAWTHDHTSYFDGTTIHIIYDVQRPQLKEFAPEEARIVRLGHAYHEVGHYLFDHLQSYLDWINENKSAELSEWKDDWATHKKYPASWLQFFGNFGLDGRMEHLLKLYYAPTADYLDFVNYHWVFPMDFRDTAGASALQDFRTLYGCLVLDVDVANVPFHEDARALLDTQMPLIEQINQQDTTKLCLDVISEIMENTWPTLLEWIELENEDCSNDNAFADDMISGRQWGDSEEETTNNTQTSREANEQQPQNANDSEDEEPSQKDFKRILQAKERELEKDEIEVALQTQEEAEHSISYQLGDDRAEVEISPMPFEEQPGIYENCLQELKPAIRNMARELRQLVAPVKDQTLRRQSRGRMVARDVWRTIHCNDSNINRVTVKGVPGKDVFINIMADISGSTALRYNEKPIVQDIRDSIITIIEATTAAKIDSRAFAFTSSYERTHIFKLKTRANAITEFNRGNIGSLAPLSGNRDAIALRYLIDDTKIEAAPTKIAFMISDGSPNFHDGESEETIRELVQQGKKLGIHVLCVFVGNDEYGLNCAKRMYGNRVIHARKGIAREMQHQIKQLLK